ncbi:MAG: polyprenyl synthetase family protein, partial [Planctomycetota bacterium]
MNESLHKPIGDFVSVQGKRIRASLTGLSYTISGGSGSLPNGVGESIELLHAGSLVIDDIQDDSTERRGRPTLHRQMGQPLAMNAGNFMYFRALEVIAGSSVPFEARCKMTTEMIRAGRICHEGQAIDLATNLYEYPANDWSAITAAITEQKTGTLVGLAMKLGAIAAEADHTMVTELARCGNQIGFALQMRNDLQELDDFANGRTERCDDLRHRRVTWPWVWFAEQRSSRQSRQMVNTVMLGLQRAQIDSLREMAGEIVQTVDGVGQREIGRRVDEPIRLLGEHVLSGEQLSALKECLHPIRKSPSSNNDSSEPVRA